MLSEYTKQLLVASAISDKIKKLEKKLEKEQNKLDKCIDSSMHLPARTGARGGMNTTLMIQEDLMKLTQKYFGNLQQLYIVLNKVYGVIMGGTILVFGVISQI